MPFEVENKFPVSDTSAVEAELRELNAAWQDTEVQVDTYYAHPSRDFANTDEALRIRRVGNRGFITYKGPKVDKTTKTRREIDLPLTAPADRMAHLLEALGFCRVAEVHKRRRSAHVSWQGQNVEVSLDDVERLGSFVELELLAEADQLQRAKDCLQSLAQHLGLAHAERRGYLELLLEG